VHGRADEALRVGGTVAAIEALSAGGYVGRADAATLTSSYHLLRSVEHRLQLQRLRRTHLVPDDSVGDGAGRRWLARAMGFRPDARGDAVAVFDAEWALHAREVRRLHEKLFYRPLLHAVARVPSDQLRLSPEQAARRLEALGFADPDGALRHLSALTAGVSRRAVIQRTLLPVVLNELADAPDPDAGLLAYRTVSDALGDSPWYLRFLRDEGQVTERLAQLLGTSRYVAELLSRAPEALRILGDDAELRPRPADALRTSFRAAAARHEDPAAAVGVRPRAAPAGAAADRRRRRARAARPGRGRRGAHRRGRGHGRRRRSDAAVRTVELTRGPLPTRVAVIAMGRVGGAETGYGSDVDALFVHDPLPGAGEEDAAAAANALVAELRRLLALPAPDPPLQVDAALRPEGRSGPLVRSLASYRAYYQAVVLAVGGAGAAAGRAAGRRRGARIGVRRAGRPAALPGRRVDAGGDHRDPPAEGADGRGAAAPRRRPGHAHEARPRRAGRRRVDRCSCCSCGTAPRCPACGPPGRCRRWPRPGTRPARPGRHRRPGGGLADRDPGPQRGRTRTGAAVGPAARAGQGPGRRDAGGRLPARPRPRPVPGRLPPRHPPGPRRGRTRLLRLTASRRAAVATRGGRVSGVGWAWQAVALCGRDR
jgi:glutamate-ammonia-ligase adenylyltransferase